LSCTIIDVDFTIVAFKASIAYAEVAIHEITALSIVGAIYGDAIVNVN
jgi:hypothetical protein